MSRKIRIAKGQVSALPSPAWTLALLTGTYPAARIAGAVALARAAEAEAEAIWQRHADALIAEAESAGFAPYYVTQRCPTGARVADWMRRFTEEHRY